MNLKSVSAGIGLLTALAEGIVQVSTMIQTAEAAGQKELSPTDWTLIEQTADKAHAAFLAALYGTPPAAAASIAQVARAAGYAEGAKVAAQAAVQAAAPTAG